MTPSIAKAEPMSAERQNSYDYDDLIQCAMGGIFGPTNGKLPKAPMLMTDRIPLITEEGGKYG